MTAEGLCVVSYTQRSVKLGKRPSKYADKNKGYEQPPNHLQNDWAVFGIITTI